VRMSHAEESEQARLARNFSELLQELRVAQAGVQILFGFLLSIAFTDRYWRESGYVHATHLITILFAAASVALLTAPAAWHRVLFRQGRRVEIVDTGSHFAVAGLACLGAAMVGTVLLLVEVVLGGWPAVALGTLAALAFGVLWFAWPARERRRPTTDRGRRDDGCAIKDEAAP
jgi:hypothetical protein